MTPADHRKHFAFRNLCFSIFVIYPKYLINLKYVEELFSEPLENLVRVAFGSSSFAMTCFINESLFEKNMLILLRKKKQLFFFTGLKIANLQRNPKLLDVHSKQDKYEEGNSFVTVYIRILI